VRSRSTRVAWGLLAAFGAIFVTANALSAANGDFRTQPLLETVPLWLAFTAFMVVGALIVAHRPGNPIGWIFSAIALLAAGGGLAETYARYAYETRPGSLPGAIVATWFAWSSWYPDGRPGGGVHAAAVPHRPAAVAALAAGRLAGRGRDGGDRGPGRPPAHLRAGERPRRGQPDRGRRRREPGRERRRRRPDLPADAVGGGGVHLPEAIGNLLFAALTAFLPIAAGIAVLRYRLYEIDRLINRTLVYGLLTVLLAGIYAGLALVGGQLSGGVADGTPSWAVAGATLAVAALFQPARRRVQAVVDRRFNRRRYDAARTVEAFSARLRDQVDLGTLSSELLAVVDQTVQPTTASLWLRP
jgi:hypothetical protein